MRRYRPQRLARVFHHKRKRMFSSIKEAYGNWVQDGKQDVSESGIHVFGAYADEYDVCRPFYPAPFWKRLESDVQSKTRGRQAVDVATGTGRGAIELARRGFQTMATDLDRGMLDQCVQSAKTKGFEDSVKILHGPAENLGTAVADNSVDVLVSLQAFHWFDAARALKEFHRVLKNIPGEDGEKGLCVLAWNDREIEIEWVAEMEKLYEKYNPLYHRRLKQAEYVTQDGRLFTENKLFEMDSFETYANPTSGCNVESLIALCNTFSYVRNAMGNEELERFEGEIRELVKYHHGDDDFDLPWVTKAYSLRPV